MSSSRTNLSRLQGRYWMLTIPASDWTPPTTLEGPLLYIKGQREIGEGGFEHWQLMVVTQKIRGQACKRLFCQTAHIELSRSEASEAYVWKAETRVEGTQFEVGTKPMQRNKKTDWDKIRRLAQNNELTTIAEQEPQVFVQSYRTLKQIATDYMVCPPNLTSCAGVWIYGPPGVGKSHFAREVYGNSMYVKAQNRWWCGYQNEKNVLMDDFDCKVMGHLLKLWADKYAFMAEVKGSSRLIRPEKLIITSNYSIDQLYSRLEDSALYEALKRRFYIIYIPMRRY